MSATPDSPSAAPGSPPTAPSAPPGRGRPRKLDEIKRREICALVSAGCGLREAGRYVDCGHNTIRREADRNPEFQQQLRQAELNAQLSPLRTMQQAAATHWRAAAWMLERAYPSRFARRDPPAFGPKQARRLLSEVLDIINSEITDSPFKRERIEKRLRVAFEYNIRLACDRRRNDRDSRRVNDFFKEKDRLSDPLGRFGFPMPDLESLLNPEPLQPRRSAPDPSPSSAKPEPKGPAPAPTDRSHSDEAPATLADFARILRGAARRVASANHQSPAADAPPPATDSTPAAPNNQ